MSKPDDYMAKNPFEAMDKYQTSVLYRDIEEFAYQFKLDNGLDDVAVDTFLIAFAMHNILSRIPDKQVRIIAKMNLAAHVARFPLPDDGETKP